MSIEEQPLHPEHSKHLLQLCRQHPRLAQQQQLQQHERQAQQQEDDKENSQPDTADLRSGNEDDDDNNDDDDDDDDDAYKSLSITSDAEIVQAAKVVAVVEDAAAAVEKAVAAVEEAKPESFLRGSPLKKAKSPSKDKEKSR